MKFTLLCVNSRITWFDRYSERPGVREALSARGSSAQYLTGKPTLHHTSIEQACVVRPGNSYCLGASKTSR